MSFEKRSPLTASRYAGVFNERGERSQLRKLNIKRQTLEEKMKRCDD